MNATTEHVGLANCAHYWVLEGDDREETHGVCRGCGATRVFQNHLPGERFAKEWRETRLVAAASIIIELDSAAADGDED